MNNSNDPRTGSMPKELQEWADEAANKFAPYYEINPRHHIERHAFVCGIAMLWDKLQSDRHTGISPDERSTHISTNESEKSTHMVTALRRIANGPDQGEHDSIEFLRELARLALESSTYASTNEIQKKLTEAEELIEYIAVYGDHPTCHEDNIYRAREYLKRRHKDGAMGERSESHMGFFDDKGVVK